MYNFHLDLALLRGQYMDVEDSIPVLVYGTRVTIQRK